MPKIVTKEEIAALSKEGKATLEEDSTAVGTNLIKILNSCNQMFEIIAENEGKTNEVLDACKSINKNIDMLVEMCRSIVANMDAQQVAIMSRIGDLNVSPVVDLTAISKSLEDLRAEVNKKPVIVQAAAVKTAEAEKKEWVFDLVKDMDGRTVQVKAKQVLH